MKTPLETRGSRANDGRSARLGKKQPDGTHAHRIAHARRRAAPDAGAGGGTPGGLLNLTAGVAPASTAKAIEDLYAAA